MAKRVIWIVLDSAGCGQAPDADLFHDDIRKPYEVGCEIQKKRLECAIAVQAVLSMEKIGKKDYKPASVNC